jgi:RNA polymerase sigma-70 factor, ECF subfamily
MGVVRVGASTDPDTDELLDRAGGGDEWAVSLLLQRHRRRLERMVALHMDHRAAGRFDPSDVVQDALCDAGQKMAGYLRDRPLPFYPWIRQLAWEQLIRYHRRHVRAQMRSVKREQSRGDEWREPSRFRLADHLVDSLSSPSVLVAREELHRRVQRALGELSPTDREILTLRFLERLSQPEAAAVLGITEGAVNMRQLRALARLRQLLEEPEKDDA